MLAASARIAVAPESHWRHRSRPWSSARAIREDVLRMPDLAHAAEPPASCQGICTATAPGKGVDQGIRRVDQSARRPRQGRPCSAAKEAPDA